MAGDQLRLDGTPEPPAPAPRGGYARPPGTGPAGETCGSCRHRRGHGGANRVYWKCGLTAWTHGAATDIRLRSPACELWAPPAAEVTCVACGAALPEERRSKPWCDPATTRQRRCWAEAHGEE